jgi:hypothetical protein
MNRRSDRNPLRFFLDLLNLGFRSIGAELTDRE